MKRQGRRFKLGVIAVLLVLFPLVVFATYLEARKVVEGVVQTFVELGFHVSSNFLHGYLEKGKSDYLETLFYKGNTYILVAGASNNTKDIDILVYDQNWENVARDKDNGNRAVIQYTPRGTGPHKIKINLKNCDGEGANWCFITGYK